MYKKLISKLMLTTTNLLIDYLLKKNCVIAIDHIIIIISMFAWFHLCKIQPCYVKDFFLFIQKMVNVICRPSQWRYKLSGILMHTSFEKFSPSHPYKIYNIYYINSVLERIRQYIRNIKPFVHTWQCIYTVHK